MAKFEAKLFRVKLFILPTDREDDKAMEKRP